MNNTIKNIYTLLILSLITAGTLNAQFCLNNEQDSKKQSLSKSSPPITTLINHGALNKKLTIQPIQVRNADGSLIGNPNMELFIDETQKIWAQAGVEVIFLTHNTYISDDVSLSIDQIDNFFDTAGGKSTTPGVINMWFIHEFSDNPYVITYADGIGGGQGLITNALFNYDYVSFIAHELGHTIGLYAHDDVMNFMTHDLFYHPTTINDIYPDGAQYGQVAPEQLEILYSNPYISEIFYVDDSATGTNNGTSWENAFNYLQDALSAADYGDEIRIAQGTYKPDQGANVTSGNRAATFQLKNGVTIKGGYAGFSTPDPELRNIELYETILSGDLAGNDSPVATADLLTEPTRSENSYNVIIVYNADDSLTLSGLTISGGTGNGTEWPYDRAGGALLAANVTCIIENCSFKNNSTTESGGAISCNSSSPKFIDCIFSQNLASNGPGSHCSNSSVSFSNCTFQANISLDGATALNLSESSATISNCLFENNTSTSNNYMAIELWHDSSTISDCIFRNNIGHSIDVNDSPGSIIDNCEFSYNSTIDDNGAAIHIWDSQPVIKNSLFNNNSAQYGGAIHIGNSFVQIFSCVFVENSAVAGGGAISFWDHTPPASQIINCKFFANTADAGGAISTWESSPDFINSLFVSNHARIGGAFDNGSNIANPSFPTISSCTIAANIATETGGAVNSWGDAAPALINNIIWYNYVNSEISQQSQINGAISTLNYNCIYGWDGTLGGIGNIGSTPTFVDPFGPDTILGTIDDDFSLTSESPCIDQGSSNIVPQDSADLDMDGNTTEPIPFDLAGLNRFQDSPLVPDTGISGNTSTPVIDMGAYEYQQNTPTNIIYVDDSATGANDGSSWNDAFIYLQDALSAAEYGDEIRIAHGIYRPDLGNGFTLGDRTATFMLKNGITINGGYAGFGATNPDGRNLDIYTSTLSGDLAENDTTAAGDLFADQTRTENSYNVVRIQQCDNTLVLSGLTITGGMANGDEWPYDRGGGIRLGGESSSIINDCTIVRNGSYTGGGVEIGGGTPTFFRCTFKRNSASSWAGGVDDVGDGSSFIQCFFDRNVSEGVGGGITIDGSNCLVKSCRFYSNYARTNGGGAIRNGAGSSTTIIDSIFEENHGHFGGAISNHTSSPIIANCTFLKNNAGTNAGAIDCYLAGPTLINCLMVDNSAQEGGAILCNNSNLKIYSSTIVANNATNVAGGIAVWGSNGLELRNNIIWYNGVNGIYNYNTQINGTVKYSQFNCIYNWDFVGGSNNIGNEPLFNDPFGPDGILGTIDDDFRLTHGSSGIDAGNSYSTTLDIGDIDLDGDTTEYMPFDLAGNPRYQDTTTVPDTGIPGSAGIPVIDMGAYESIPNNFILSNDTVYIPENGQAQFNLSLSASPAAPLLVNVSIISGDSDIFIISDQTFTLDSNNYSTGIPVLLAAAEDIDILNGIAKIQIAANGVTTKIIDAVEVDDTVTITVEPQTSATWPVDTEHNRYLATSDDPLAIFNGGSVHFRGTNEGGSQEQLDGMYLIYRYKLEFKYRVNINKINLSGVAFWGNNSKLRLLDQNMNVIASTPTYGQNTYKYFEFITADAAGKVFYIDEYDISSTWRYRDSLNIDFDINYININITPSPVLVDEGQFTIATVTLADDPGETLNASAQIISGDSSISILYGDTFTFNSTNWQTGVQIILAADEDIDWINGQATLKIDVDGLPPIETTVTEIDNDTYAPGDLSQWPVDSGGNDHYYMAVYAPTAISWHQANTAAQAAGGYLATLTSQAENDFVFGLIDYNMFWNAHRGPWIGGFQPDGSPEPDGNWQWVTGEPFNYSNWDDEEPNDKVDENAIQFYGDEITQRQNQWNDLESSGSEIVVAYIIEFDSIPTLPQPVSFADQNLKTAVEDTLQVTNPTVLDMVALEILIANNKSISSISGLEYAKYLSTLYLNNNQVTSLEPLTQLENLITVSALDNPLGYNTWCNTRYRIAQNNPNLLDILLPANPNAIPGDANSDCIVDMADLEILISEWLIDQ